MRCLPKKGTIEVPGSVTLSGHLDGELPVTGSVTSVNVDNWQILANSRNKNAFPDVLPSTAASLPSGGRTNPLEGNCGSSSKP